MKVAFHAPLKPPDHPTPSGDRRMARLIMAALNRAGFEPMLASDLRAYDGKGDAARQDEIAQAAAREVERLTVALHDAPPVLWFTYHCYYKAPDLIGPKVAATLGIPYVIAEASRAKKRLDGPWARFARAAETAIDAAHTVFVMSPRDREALERDRTAGQRLIDLPPFLDPGAEICPNGQKTDGRPFRLLTVAMMREGAKLDSYRALADALAHLSDVEWSLKIVGDGDARARIEALYAPFGDRVTFAGAIADEAAMRRVYENADIFVWPGIGEAYGMVYLEAQAAGLPVAAEDHPGPRSVIAPDYPLTPAGDARALADAIRRFAAMPPGAGQAGRAHVLARHSLDSAAVALRESLGAMV